MPDTLITPDGRLHTLLGSTTLESIVREYAGSQVADAVRALAERDAYEEARAETDLGAYEQSLEHWHRMAQDWADELEAIAQKFDSDSGFRRAAAARRIRLLKGQIESEL